MTNASSSHQHGMVSAGKTRPKSSLWKKRQKERARERKKKWLESLA